MANCPINHGVHAGSDRFMLFFHESEKPNEPLPMPETLENHAVSYVAEGSENDPDEIVSIRQDVLTELLIKAAKWDTIAPKLQCLSDFFNDLKGGKP